MNYLVLDFGGSAVKGAVMTRHAEIVERFTLTSHAKTYEAWLDAFTPVFEQYRIKYNILGIAVSTCGAVDVDTGIIHGGSALPYIHGFDVKSLYEDRFGLPTELENDACCAALAESWLGAGSDSNHFALVVIGTGVGGAIVTHQQIMKGHHLHGGEFGFSIMEYRDGKPITLGYLASTLALVELAASALSVSVETLNGLKVFEMYEQQHPEIVQVVDQWIGYLATGLYNIQYSIDPEVIIIGGAISRRHDLLALINHKLDCILADIQIAKVRPVLKVTKFGNDANLIGALKHYMNKQG
ncbi:transcriptional regulator [Vibrio sp. 10N.286.49.C2]|uniref:ROK family protein n=1 Tax=unclassified Vibrio TaxID=2614977 RepID=UPI000C83C255|nr:MULTISPECIES: ROK family protein [unclassified Vibrio]PMH38096.1 transcriptional regulator [Vibrio sp. 10N.286.49.C2]PMH53698.1 transcriptional regulator [Vibrio sp. 10N.286.49.B1]PMH80151.1 transcriptional regulator [Vibrio sp. 10N.286.48.B7]